MKVKQALESAMALINERDSSGEFHSDVGDFEKNAPRVVSSIITLMTPDDCIVKGLRPSEAKWGAELTSLEDDIPLHEALASAVPLGLAAFLLLEEDSVRAESFFALFKAARERVVATFTTGTRGSVRNVY